jgi:hypothetical protein
MLYAKWDCADADYNKEKRDNNFDKNYVELCCDYNFGLTTVQNVRLYKR